MFSTLQRSLSPCPFFLLPSASVRLWNSGSSLETGISMTCGWIASAAGSAKEMHPDRRITSRSFAGAPVSGKASGAGGSITLWIHQHIITLMKDRNWTVSSFAWLALDQGETRIVDFQRKKQSRGKNNPDETVVPIFRRRTEKKRTKGRAHMLCTNNKPKAHRNTL